MLIPKNSKDVKGLREFITAVKTQMCSAAGAFSEPLKNVFGELERKFDGLLSSLPADDKVGDWSLECQLENLFGLVTLASGAASAAALENQKLKETQAEMSRQFASKVTAEVQAKITAGELMTKEAHTAAITKATEGYVPQATVTQLCSEALNKGIVQGETKVRGELTAAEALRNLISTRKTGLQQAGVALPEAAFESVLGGSDTEFATAKATFEARVAEFKKDGIQLNSADLLANCWLPEKEFAVFKKTVAGIPALKIVGEPLATPGGPGATGRPLVV